MKPSAPRRAMIAAAALIAAAFPVGSQERAGDQAKGTEAAIRRIGVLCPLEGRFATLGESFLRGASIALKETRLKGIGNVELVVGDTRGNPLESRAVAERLIRQEHVDALLGEVLSSSTIAAAQVAELSKTVLLSPVATEEGIGGFGSWVFQMTTSAEVEIAALAHMACRRLGLRRVAFMSSDDLSSRRIARLFGDEVERLGGQLVIAEFYPEGSTDFAESIGRVRAADPEALFVASGTEDLILILPQLSFHEFGVQLLGTSAWNSRRLVRMVGKDLEGALFPVDIDQRAGEALYLNACALVNEPAGEVNQVVVGGYRGTKLLIEALAACTSGGTPLREEMSRLLEKRRHPFIDLMAGEGILFYTVRNERAVEYGVLKAER
jgi:branched-chain amino acid transport system substrate-binding protein